MKSNIVQHKQHYVLICFLKAVMLFGGWSRNMADFVTMNDLMSLKDRLISWGYAENNIRTFFANGINMSMDDGEYLFYRIISINIQNALL